MYDLKDRITWRGEPAVIVGKTYGGERVYAIRTARGQLFQDVPERQIGAPDNVVPLHDHA